MLIYWAHSAFTSILQFVLNLFPDIDMTVPVDIASTIGEWIQASSIIFPINDVIAILTISFAITNFRILYNTFFKIWKALPLT